MSDTDLRSTNESNYWETFEVGHFDLGVPTTSSSDDSETAMEDDDDIITDAAQSAENTQWLGLHWLDLKG